METNLASQKILVERKLFFLDYKENPRGRFLKITEDVGGRRDTVIIPSTGLLTFRDALDKIIEADRQTPPAPMLDPPAAPPSAATPV